MALVTDDPVFARQQPLTNTDPAIAQVIHNETTRQNDGLELIASENFVSKAVLEAAGSVLTNKYAEGYPGKRYYGGCEVVDKIEQLAIDRAKKLFGVEYDAPFGIAPIGLQGLIWPRSPEILAKAAFDNNIPFILSTVSTSNIEKISEITEGKSWFQLYHPSDDSITENILKRAEDSGINNLVILADVPTFGYRSKEIINGLSLPPRITMSNLKSMLSKPKWLINTIINGKPSFDTLKPYMTKNLTLKQLGKFMDATFSGRLNKDKISRLRDLWKGNIIIKGLESIEDIKKIK